MSNDEQHHDKDTRDESSEALLHWASEDLERPAGEEDERAERQAEADEKRKVGPEADDPWVE
ncbi:hypothetical protein GCM10027053_43660 [Intrasporangium mesophilum]